MIFGFRNLKTKEGHVVKSQNEHIVMVNII